MSNIRTGHSDLISDDFAGVCGGIAILIGAWESHIAIKLMSSEEAFTADFIAAQWIYFAQQVGLGAHMYIFEDEPCLAAESGPHADEGGKILSGICALGCTTIEDSRIRGRT
jgi:hypothetical protein